MENDRSASLFLAQLFERDSSVLLRLSSLRCWLLHNRAGKQANTESRAAKEPVEHLLSTLVVPQILTLLPHPLRLAANEENEADVHFRSCR